MRHFLLYIPPDAVWSTLGELLKGQPNSLRTLPADYVDRERAFVGIGERFFSAVGAGKSFRFITVFEDSGVERSSPLHPAVYDTLNGSREEVRRILANLNADELSPNELCILLQLAARALITFCVEGPKGEVLATVDDTFYWYVSLPDDVEPELLCGQDDVEILPSIDIFDPA